MKFSVRRRIAAAQSTCIRAAACAVLPVLATVWPGSVQAAVSTQVYQKMIVLSCPTLSCAADIPTVAAKRRLTIQRMSCFVNGPTDLQFQFGQLMVRDAADTIEGAQMLTPAFRSSEGILLFNQEMSVVIRTGRHGELRFHSAVKKPYYVACSLFGTVEVFS